MSSTPLRPRPGPLVLQLQAPGSSPPAPGPTAPPRWTVPPARPALPADRGRPRTRAALLALLAGGVLAAACARPTSGATDGQAAQVAGGVRAREVPRVRVAPCERHEMEQVLETMTKLESEREIQLFPRLPGVVVSLHAEEGDHVEAGDVLAELDARDEELGVSEARVSWEEAQNTAEMRSVSVDEAKARIESAKLAARQSERDYERNVALYQGEDQVASALSAQALEASLLERDKNRNEERLAELALEEANVDARLAKNAVDRAKATLDRAQLQLSYKSLRAPFAGVVAERRVRVGDSVGTSEPAFVLSDVDDLRAVFNRPQEERSLFIDGLAGKSDGTAPRTLAIEATAEALPGHVFPGHVERISPTIDPESGQFRVTARLQDGEAAGGAQLLPGMLVRMKIVTDRHPDVLVVPKRALRREGERRYLLVVVSDGTDATVRRVDVQEGYDDDENVEVAPLEGQALAEGDLVVVIGSRDLKAGDAVQFEETRPGAEEPVEGEAVAPDAGKDDE